MPGRERLTSTARRRALFAKKGLRRRKYAPVKPKGKVIYENPKAVPVEPVIQELGKRKPFELKNVEWITSRGFVAEGGFAELYRGRIKIKGVTPSQSVVIKHIYPDDVIRTFHSKEAVRSVQYISEVIRRVYKSGVTHPHMACFEADGKKYIVMEPFLRKLGSATLTKFVSRGDVIRNLDLTTPLGASLFREAVEETGRLSRAGLRIGVSRELMGGQPRADVFNAIPLKNGARKLFVQDLDTLEINANMKQNWQKSTKHLLDVSSATHLPNTKIARQIIAQVAKAMGFAKK